MVEYPVLLTSMEELMLDGDDALDQLWNHDFEKEWNEFLQKYESKDVETLKDIVRFNSEHSEKALPPPYPGQQLLESATDEKRKISDEKYYSRAYGWKNTDHRSSSWISSWYHASRILGIERPSVRHVHYCRLGARGQDTASYECMGGHG